MTMYRRRAASAALLTASVLLAAPALAAQATSPMSFLAGTWTVVGVEVSAGGVQALAHDDPAYVGKKLVLDATRFAWNRPATSGGTIDDECRQPQLHRMAIPAGGTDDRIAALHTRPVAAFAVSCASGSWGPQGADAPRLLRLSDGSLALDWYDGGLLRLKKS